MYYDCALQLSTRTIPSLISRQAHDRSMQGGCYASDPSLKLTTPASDNSSPNSISWNTASSKDGNRSIAFSRLDPAQLIPFQIMGQPKICTNPSISSQDHCCWKRQSILQAVVLTKGFVINPFQIFVAVVYQYIYI
jgi:hypothetical protein